MFDLIVIGGGPAGSAAAITAARNGTSVLLLERGKFPRHKVCGEFVSAESLELLGDLLGSQGTSVLEGAIRIESTRVFVDGRVLRTKIDPPAASIARIDLDADLWSAAKQNGVEARDQVTVQALRQNGHFTVATTTGNFESRAVINASGRWSNLTAGAHANGNVRWLGLKAHFFETAPEISVDLYFFEGGYCGVQPVTLSGSGDEARVNVCAMVRADVATNLLEVFAQNPDLQRRAGAWKPLTDPVSTSPLYFCPPEPVRDNVLMAGDAVAFVDPFVGDGISLALRSGAFATDCLIPFFADRMSLAQAAMHYRQCHGERLSSVYRVSSRIRRLLEVPRTIRVPLVALLERTPAITQYLVKKTR